MVTQVATGALLLRLMPLSPPARTRVLFVCVANSCRSQIAEAVGRTLAGDAWEVWSAGSQPSGRVHPLAVQLMAEIGQDLSTHRSKGLGEVPAVHWDYVVTMGCGDACPTVNARRHVAWDIPDPVGLSLDEARRMRDQIADLVRQLMSEHAERRGRPH